MKLHRIVPRESVEAAIRANRNLVRREWHKYPAAMSFLHDQYPGPWAAINACRMNWNIKENPNRPGYVLLSPRYTCKQRPFCILCNRSETWGRVHVALDRFVGCTPGGQKERFIHIVQTAPIGETGQYLDGGDWGRQALADPKGFRRIVWDTLREFYGDGIGAFLTFQPFGEQPTKKWHPHVDLTLNGWSIEDDRAQPTRTIDLANGGRSQWDEAVRARAMRYQVNAAIGNVQFGHAIVSEQAYARILYYQTRELVNPESFIEYNRTQGILYWRSYHDNSRTKIPVREFRSWLAEYQGRFGFWGDGHAGGRGRQRAHLEQFYGHLSKGRWEATKIAVGGRDRGEHAFGCECEYCGEWQYIELEEVERAVGRAHLTQKATPWPEAMEARPQPSPLSSPTPVL